MTALGIHVKFFGGGEIKQLPLVITTGGTNRGACGYRSNLFFTAEAHGPFALSLNEISDASCAWQQRRGTHRKQARNFAALGHRLCALVASAARNLT